MLTNVISIAHFRSVWCQKLISWKHSFNRLNEEYAIAKKKEQALDNLYSKGKISQSTHDSFSTEIAQAISEIEKQQQGLLQKMSLKTAELEGQIKTLEMLLANYEIQHVTGEIDEDTYNLQINLLANSLATAKHELDNIKLASDQIITHEVPTPEPTLAPEPVPTPTVEVASPQPEAAEIPVETAQVELTPVAPEPIITEPTVAAEAAPETIPEQPQTPAPVEEAPQPVAPVEPEPTPEAETPPAETAPAVEQTIVEAPVSEEATVVAETPIVEEYAPTVEVEAPAEGTVEAPSPTIEEKIAEPQVAEEPIVEQPMETVETSQESVTEATIESQTPVIQEETIEQPSEEVEIAVEMPDSSKIDANQQELIPVEITPVVEEITENPSQEAPAAALEETPAEIAAEVLEETHQESTSPSAKEMRHATESMTESRDEEE